MFATIVVAAIVYGAAAYLSAELARYLGRVSGPLVDGPSPQQVPLLILVGCSTMIGAFMASRHLAVLQLVVIAVICASLVGAWYCDVSFGIIPDYFTLVPLAIVLGISIYHGDYQVVFSAILGFLPFGVTAFVSKGRGVGWGDAKLAALGGAVLGVELTLLSYVAACLVAVGVAWSRGRRSELVAFAPYLSAAIVFGILLRAAVTF